MDISDMNLSVRDFNAVKRFGINSTGELIERLPDFCKEHRRTGAKVTEALHKLGLLPFHLGEWVEPERCTEELAPEEFQEGAFIIMGFPTESRDWRKVVMIIKIDGDQLYFIDGKSDLMHHTIGDRTCWRIAEGYVQELEVPEPPAEHPDILSIESTCFVAMRCEFNAMLQKTLGSMIRRESDEATLTLKLHLRLNHTSDSLQRTVIRPDITHKITSAITVKDDLSGAMQGDYELLYDNDADRYFMRELPSDDGQMCLF